MAKFVLDNDFDYDLLLVGISSHARDYRMCWALNSGLKLQLAKAEKGIKSPGVKNDTIEFPLFEFADEDSRITWALIGNKAKNVYLVPELKHADYLLMLRDNTAVELTKLLEQVRACDQVITAFEIKTDELKSRDNLIYF